MKNKTAISTAHQSLRVALEGLSSEEVLSLNEEIESIALERIEAEEKGRVRQECIIELRALLAKAGITPEELLAFTSCPTSASKRLK